MTMDPACCGSPAAFPNPVEYTYCFSMDGDLYVTQTNPQNKRTFAHGAPNDSKATKLAFIKTFVLLVLMKDLTLLSTSFEKPEN